MRFGSDNQAALRLVSTPAPDPGVEVAWLWFCGHCGHRTPEGVAPAPDARVCEECGFGLLLETQADLAPDPQGAFLVVDSRLRIHGVSGAAERLLGLTETEAAGRPVAELLVAPDAEAGRPNGLPSLIAEVAGGGEATHTYVRPWNTFGIRLRARISPCGPPRAALVVLGGSPPLRAVS
jgi:PAS domain-containing protein